MDKLSTPRPSGFPQSLIAASLLALIILSVGAGFYVLGQLENDFERLAEGRSPAVKVSEALVMHKDELVSSLYEVQRSATPEVRQEAIERARVRMAQFTSPLDTLSFQEGSRPLSQEVLFYGNRLFENILAMEVLLDNRLRFQRSSEDIHDQIASARTRLHRALQRDPAKVVQHQLDLLGLLSDSFVMSDVASLTRLEAAFETAFVALSEDTRQATLSFVDEVLAFGTGQRNLFRMRQGQLLLVDQLQALDFDNRSILQSLDHATGRLVAHLTALTEPERQAPQGPDHVRSLIMAVMAGLFICALLVGAWLASLLHKRRVNRLLSGVVSETWLADDPSKQRAPARDGLGQLGAVVARLAGEIERQGREIRKSELRFRDFALSGSDWYWETGADLRFVDISGGFFELTGLSKTDAIGERLEDVLGRHGKEIEPGAFEGLRQKLNGSRSFRNLQFSMASKEGQVLYVKLSGVAVFAEDGSLEGYRGTGADLTADYANRTRLQTLNEIMPGAFAIWDHNDNLASFNLKFLQLYAGAGSAIRVGLPFKDFLAILVAKEVIQDPNGSYHSDRLAYHSSPQGSFSEALAEGTALQVNELQAAEHGTVTLVVDVSERVSTVKALEGAMDTAQKADQAKSRFLAAASHDLRQPIHAMGMFLSALRERRRKDSGEARDTDLRLIENASGSLEILGELLYGLLDLSKLDAGAVSPSIDEVDLGAVMARVTDALKERAQEKGLDLRCVPTSCRVRTDPVILERILRHVIANAIRFTDHGKVLVGGRHSGGRVVVQVLDTGIGIASEHIPAVYEEFHQVGNPTRDRRKGLGVGLAIVKRSAALLGHEIGLVSKPDQGTRFSLVLPRGVGPAAPGRSSPGVASDHDPEATACILVVDDDQDILTGMKALLEGWGYRALVAASSQEALELARSGTSAPSLLVVDYRLEANTDGAETIRLLHEAWGVRIPAFIVTGDTDPERIREARESGFVVQHKPLKPARIRQLIRNALAGNL